MKDSQQILQLTHWPLSFPAGEPKHERAVQLYSQGWAGEVLSPLSAFEVKLCTDFIKRRSNDTYWLNRKTIEIAIHASTLRVSEWSMWFKEKSDHARFCSMLDSIPPRIYYYNLGNHLHQSADQESARSGIIKRMANKNWSIFIATDQNNFLTVQEISPSDDVWLKMMLER